MVCVSEESEEYNVVIPAPFFVVICISVIIGSGVLGCTIFNVLA